MMDTVMNIMNKVKLNFMVVPEHLEKYGDVDDKVRVKITNVYEVNLRFNNILGESGVKLAKAGAHFYFRRVLAERMVFLGIAEEIKNEN